MLKVKREDFTDLTEDDKFNLDNVNDLFLKISEEYQEKENKEKDDDRKKD